MSDKPEVEWFTDPHSWDEYGVICLAGKWAAVKADAYSLAQGSYQVITEWVDDRKTAVGFLKLLKEK